MAILVLWASPDLNGMTAEAKDRLCKGIVEGGKTVEEIHLNRKKILHCAACGKGGYGKCRTEGNCILKDDFSEIYAAMCNAEAIALITPVYWHDISENFKALLDRIRRCETVKNGFLRNKRAFLVACAGGYGSGTLETLTNLENILSHMGIRALDRIPVVRFNRNYMMPAIQNAGKTLAEDYDSFRFDEFNFWE